MGATSAVMAWALGPINEIILRRLLVGQFRRNRGTVSNPIGSMTIAFRNNFTQPLIHALGRNVTGSKVDDDK
jgi:hypothetical protein